MAIMRGTQLVFVVTFACMAGLAMTAEVNVCTGKPPGISADPTNCQCYFNCNATGVGGVNACCQKPLCFNPSSWICDYCENVNCVVESPAAALPVPKVPQPIIPRQVPAPKKAASPSPKRPSSSSPCLSPGPRGSITCRGRSITDIITRATWNKMFVHGPVAARCSNKGFLSYTAFVIAAKSFQCFGNEGSVFIRRRELAAFLGQVGHETSSGQPSTVPDGPYAWGLCHISERRCAGNARGCEYCVRSAAYGCTRGKKYFGRGPLKLTSNVNYGIIGQRLGLGLRLLNNPDLVLQDSVLSWKTAIALWMTARGPKPSAHNVMVNNWKPTADDRAAGRAPNGIGSYGLVTNILKGGRECGGSKPTADQVSRRRFYVRFLYILGISSPDTCDKKTCERMRPYS